MLAVDPDFEREPEAAKADDEVQVRVQRLQNVSDSLCQTGRPRRRTHKLSLNEIPSTGRGGISYVRDVRITSEQGGGDDLYPPYPAIFVGHSSLPRAYGQRPPHMLR